jgi:hypothetical protein
MHVPITLSLPPLQSEALNEMVTITGLSKSQLVMHGVELLNIAIRAKKQHLELVLRNQDDMR